MGRQSDLFRIVIYLYDKQYHVTVIEPRSLNLVCIEDYYMYYR